MSSKRSTPSRDADFEDVDFDVNELDGDEFDSEEFDGEDDLDDFELDDADILDWCGERNARKGQTLLTQGAITARSLDGSTIRGTFVQGERRLPLLCDLADGSAMCTDANHTRTSTYLCEHVAALLYTFLDEPDTFAPQNADQIAAPANLPRSPQERLTSLLRALTVEQLRAIGRRRGWPSGGSAKDKLVDAIAAGLARELMPAALEPDEEQLLRIEGTLYGLSAPRTPQELATTWKKHGGGDPERLEQALGGLQSAGLLFPCALEGSSLHYHWQPLLDPSEIPLLPTKVKAYPADKAERLRPADPLPSPATVADAIVEMAEHARLHLRTAKFDRRLSKIAGEWPFDPQQVERLAKSRNYAGRPATLTVPFGPAWAEETWQEMATLAGGSRDLAEWVSGALMSLGILVPSGIEFAVVDQEAADGWRKQTLEQRERALWDSWRLGGAGVTELEIVTAHSSLLVERSLYDPNFTPSILIYEMTQARQFITRLVAALDPLTWYSWKSFAESVRNLRADWTHTRTSPETWYLASKTRHRYEPYNAQHWDAAYCPLLAAMLEGVLHWTGAVELGYDGKELAALRVTPVGMWLLAGGKEGDRPGRAEGEPDGRDSIRWLDDATLQLSATPNAVRVLPLVRSFADPTRQPLVLRVSDASLARAVEHGATASDLADRLAAVGAPLPPRTRAQLEAVEAQFGRFHVYDKLTVLELADDMALRELLAGTSLERYVVHQFSPRLVVVRDEGIPVLAEELIKKGYTPRVLDNQETTHDP